MSTDNPNPNGPHHRVSTINNQLTPAVRARMQLDSQLAEMEEFLQRLDYFLAHLPNAGSLIKDGEVFRGDLKRRYTNLKHAVSKAIP